MKTTIKTIYLLLFMTALSNLISCSEDSETTPDVYACDSCNRIPEGLPANDQSAKGVYKGIIVGSTGVIRFDIQNGSDIITATMTLDGEEAVLTSTVTVTDGEVYFAPFTGEFNGSTISVTFQVSADGSGATVVSSDIPGHPNAVFEVYKETSTSLIEAFEGNYTEGNITGTFNILLTTAHGKWGGIAKENQSGEVSHIEGTIDSSNRMYNEDGNKIGDKNGDVVEGSFTNGSGQSVVFSGNRTL